MSQDAREIIKKYFKENPEQLAFYEALPEKQKGQFLLKIVNASLRETAERGTQEVKYEEPDEIQILLEYYIDPILSLGKSKKETAKSIVYVCENNPRGNEMEAKLAAYLAKKGRSDLVEEINRIVKETTEEEER